MKILVVGLGNMGFSIAKALCKSGNSYEVHAYDPWSKFLDTATSVGITIHDSLNVENHISSYDVVLIGVKPNLVQNILHDISPIIYRDTPTLLSIAAGTSLEKLATGLENDGKMYPYIVRYMPTIAALEGKSITAMSCQSTVRENDKNNAIDVAESFGKVIEIPENLMDAFTGVAGSGIAFATAFIEALTLGGVKEGLPYDKAYESARLATSGALALLEHSFSSPSALMTAISSPGGTTIAGIHALHECGLHATVMNAVCAAADRSREIQKINHKDNLCNY